MRLKADGEVKEEVRRYKIELTGRDHPRPAKESDERPPQEDEEEQLRENSVLEQLYVVREWIHELSSCGKLSRLG